MEKASTPRNRLTRSSAKQVNTPKITEQEESLERSSEEIKHNVRKTRRRYDSKGKTNGDTTNIENRVNKEEMVEDNVGDKCEEEEINLNNKSEESPKTDSQKTPSPSISRRSLRTRRSSTPGLELESSASKKMKRSSSFGKLDLASTPTNKRGRRARSESKDFVFTPSKDSQGCSYDSNGKYIPSSSLRMIEKIDEVNEGEKSSEDEKETVNQEKKSLINIESERKVIEPIENKDSVDQSELKTDNETNIRETDKSNDSEIKAFKLGYSSSPKINNGDKIIDISQNNSVFLNDDAEAAEKMEPNTKTEVKGSTSPMKSDSSSIEVDKLPNTTTIPESIKSVNTGSPDKEMLQSNEFQSENTTEELASRSEYKTIQQDIVKDEVNENLDCEIQESKETNEIIYNNIVETHVESVSNDRESDEDYDNESLVTYQQSNDQLQSIMGENMEGSDNESRSSFSNGNVKREQKTQNETNIVEISEIELINSSDDDDTCEEKCENQTIIKFNSDGSCTENEKISVSAIDEDKCMDESAKEMSVIDEDKFVDESAKEMSAIEEDKCLDKLPKEILSIDEDKCMDELAKENIESEMEVNPSDLVLEKSPLINNTKISENHNYQEQDEVKNADIRNENTESTKHNTNNIEANIDQSSVGLMKENNVEEISALHFIDSEPNKSFDIVIENPHTIAANHSIRDNLTTDAQEKNNQNSLSQIKCPNLDQEHNLYEQNELEEMDNEPCIRLNEQDQSDIMLDKDDKPQSENYYDEGNYNEEHFDENYEGEEINKSEEGSCDIYKGLSDSGSYVDEKGDGSQFGESVSSELQSRSGDSEEEYVTSIDDDEENMEEKTRLINEICSGPIGQKAKELLLSKDSEKPNEKNPDSPMTYDKALAIINKNRVKKIDDEEFFDMFTQELNRVSEESGSDSDIAIVDEYLMEDEPAKKNSQKSGNAQNAKQSPRLAGPTLQNYPMPPENYPGSFNQQHPQHGNVINQHSHPVPSQHSHSAIQRANYTQGAMYQQFDQNMHIRGQFIYNQYAHPSTSMQEPHIFNPPVSHSDVNFGNGVFSHPHPLCPVSESSFPHNGNSLKVRTVTDMNSGQSLGHRDYSSADHVPFNTSEERTFDGKDDKDNYLSMNSTAVPEGHKIDTGSTRSINAETARPHEFSDKKGSTSRTPILDLLGLDEKALKLLKKVLGLNTIERKLMKRDLEWQKKCLEKNILKSELRQRGRKSELRFRNMRRFRGSDSSSLKSSEQSSEESSTASSGFSKGGYHGSTSGNDSREVNIEDGSVYVTFKPKNKLSYRNGKKSYNFKKTSLKNPENAKVRNTTKFARKTRNTAMEHSSKKMTQKHITVVKSQCGTFTVDPLTASSLSSDSEVPSLDDKFQAQELRRKMKRDLASGKNKLSNMFTQHCLKTKESKKNVPELFQNIKGPLGRKNSKELKKLPSEVLETLAKEDKRKKRQRTDSGSDELSKMPKKIRKRNQKMKLKSKAGDQNYIPCVTGGSTEFGLSRLDKEGNLTLAEKAAKFRTDQLYGASVKRITILDFKHQWC